VKAMPAIPDDSDYERAIPDDSDYERVDSSEDEANVEVSSASVPATPSVPSVAELGRQEQRMIRLMENSDTDPDSEPLVLLDPSAPGYDQIRDQARIDHENEQTMLRRWIRITSCIDHENEQAMLRLGEGQNSDSDPSGLSDTPPLPRDNSEYLAEFDRQQRALAAEVPVMYKTVLVIDKHPSSLNSGKFAVRPAGAPFTSHPFFHVDADGEHCEDPGTETA
jgi:hypothetical protein